jgi:hypothetical protein
MLAVMMDEKQHSVTSLVEKLHLNRNGSSAENIKYNIERLSAMMYLMIARVATENSGARYVITSMGIGAVRRHVKSATVPTKAMPPASDLFRRDKYEPDDRAFYRNNGHVDKPRRGVPC